MIIFKGKARDMTYWILLMNTTSPIEPLETGDFSLQLN